MKILRDFKVGQQHFRRGGVFVKPAVLTAKQVEHLIDNGFLESDKMPVKKEQNK